MSHQSELPDLHRCECPTCRQHPDSPTAEVHRAINRFLAAADERSRRLLAGSLAQQHGAAASPWWHASPASAPIPSVADNASCHRLPRLSGDGSAALEPGASRLKKKSWGRDGPGGVIGGRHRRRPDHRAGGMLSRSVSMGSIASANMLTLSESMPPGHILDVGRARQAAGRRDQLLGILQRRYGYERDRAERELDKLTRTW